MREWCLVSLYRALLEALHSKGEARLSPGLFLDRLLGGAWWPYTSGVSEITVTPFFRRCWWQSMLYAG